MEEVIIIGAGPCGLSAAAELNKLNIDALVIEKGSIVHSIYQYPTFMQFFSTPELLEVGDVPFLTPNEKPTRQEALYYYRRVAKERNLRIHPYETVTSIERIETEEGFRVYTTNRYGEMSSYAAKCVIVATGYFDHPNLLGIPGEEMAKVSHFFKEAHPYHGMKVAIIGGNNSAVDAAMELQRIDAEVTVIYRGADYSNNIKPWVRPLFESMVHKGRIQMLFQTRVTEIHERTISVEEASGNKREIQNDYVLALTGFRPDHQLITSVGVEIDPNSNAPLINPNTMETNVGGLYIAGVIASGNDANQIFIENGRMHGGMIARHIARSRS